MKRVYDQGIEENVEYFVGTEVEHTPQFGKRTLFVVGAKDTEDVISMAQQNGCKHIYCGANMSFNVTSNTESEWRPWESMVFPLLKEGYWVTLDIDASQIEGLLESGFTEYNRFIPMISVKLPYIKLFNYNATIKLDDTTWGKSNPGVWCHSVHDLMDRKVYTDWKDYVGDTVIK